jgi:maltooligosyltrehalose trehalohydrolase
LLKHQKKLNTFLQKIGAWYNPLTSEFIVWAPLSERVELLIDGSAAYPMAPAQLGYWNISLSLPPGAHYLYRLDGQHTFPDPASFSQPDGVHGASELVDRSGFCWRDEDWKGMPLSNMIIYELHTGCFSGTHDFEGVIGRLDYLADLGVNTIELMPLGQVPGDRNWGYDGVYPFAIQHSYGGFGGFQQLVDAAHAKGIAVIVDVVYNHFGPEGSFAEQFGPYLTDKYHTPWGKAINYDDAWSDGVRNYFLQNARMWLEDYHVDGLRLDAVHAIKDFSAVHFIQQMKELATDIEQRTGSQKLLIAEIDLNDPRYIHPAASGGYGLDGQWIDEFHHALRAYMTGEANGWLQDFGELAHLEHAFTQTYVYNGVYSPHRKRTFGGNAMHNPFSQFIVFSQNHDQVGNRAIGDRLSSLLLFEQLKLAAATVLLSPYIPLLFMGEEYGEKNPFQFFVSHTDPVIIENTRRGRREEFAGFIVDKEIPDPQSELAFQRSNLSWNYKEGEGAILLDFYRHLIRFRKIRPAMQGMTRDDLHMLPAPENTLCFERKIISDTICIWLHFGDKNITLTNTHDHTLVKIFDSASVEWMGPAEVSPQCEILPGGIIELHPHSATVFEKKP